MGEEQQLAGDDAGQAGAGEDEQHVKPDEERADDRPLVPGLRSQRRVGHYFVCTLVRAMPS
jgi:hypothetical protein